MMSLSRMETNSSLIMVMRNKYQDETTTHFTDQRQGNIEETRIRLELIPAFEK